MIIIIINATWASAIVPHPPRCEVCDTPGRKGRAPQKSPHMEIMLEQGMLEGKYALKPKFRVNLDHSASTVSVWLGCQEGQSWEVKGKAAAAPAELAKEGAAAALTQRKERESSRSRGENGRAQRSGEAMP